MSIAVVTALLLACSIVAGGVVAWRRRESGRARRIVQAIAHDLRTPLATIQSSSELLLRGNGLGPEHGRWVGVIARETNQLASRIENLIVFAWAQRGELLVLRAPLDMSELLSRIATAAGAMAAAHDTMIETAVAEDIHVRGDASRLGQAFGNIIDNAIRFGPRGQTVRIALESDGGDALVTISDQGPGVPRRDRRRVWRPFVRHGRNGGPDGGTGLGLAVARAIVAAHGGRVAVDDAPGGGARFRIQLPVSPRNDRDERPRPRRATSVI